MNQFILNKIPRARNARPYARNIIVGAGFYARPWIRWITRDDTEVVPYNFGKRVGADDSAARGV